MDTRYTRAFDDWSFLTKASIERIESGQLSERDRVSFREMLLGFGEELNREISQAPGEHRRELQEIMEAVNMIAEGLESSDTEKLKSGYDVFQRWEFLGHMPDPEFGFQPREDGRTYIPTPSNITKEQFNEFIASMKAAGGKFDAELKQWYVDADWTPKTPGMMQIKVSIPCMSKENFAAAEKYLNEVGALFKAQTDKFGINTGHWYVPGDTPKEKINAIREHLADMSSKSNSIMHKLKENKEIVEASNKFSGSIEKEKHAPEHTL